MSAYWYVAGAATLRAHDWLRYEVVWLPTWAIYVLAAVAGVGWPAFALLWFWERCRR